MEKIYYNLIKQANITGWTIDMVPALWREKTQSLLDADTLA